MGILPDAPHREALVDLVHLAVFHNCGPDGERIQVRDASDNFALVATFSLEAAATISTCLHRGDAGAVEFAVRLDREIAAAIYDLVARSRARNAL